MAEEVTYYELSRYFFDWCYENSVLVNPNHIALYFFCLEHGNRMGHKEQFRLPMEMAMDAIGIKNYKTWSKTFNDLIEWNFIKLVTKSTNQYSANVIAIVKNTKATYKARGKALDKATLKHDQKQSEKQVHGIVGIIKPLNQLTTNQEPLTTNQEAAPYDQFISFLNLTFKRKYSGCKKSRSAFDVRVREGATIEDFKKAVENGFQNNYHKETNYNYLTPEFFTRADKLESFKNQIPVTENANGKNNGESQHTKFNPNEVDHSQGLS